MFFLMSLNVLGSGLHIKNSLFFLLEGTELLKKEYLSYASCLVLINIAGL